MNDRAQMIESNLGLVHSCANRFRNRGVEYDDLFQAGCVGLLKAVDGFDETLGFVFSTYAVPAILGEIKRIFRDGGTVKVSRSLKEQAKKMQSEKERLTDIMGREPTIQELAEFTESDYCTVSELLLVSRPVLSLTPQNDDTDDVQIDVPVEGESLRIDDRICLDECINALSENDRLIIELRYYKGKTQSIVAEELGMSQVQVSRREKKILKEIREKMIV
jgi:RNA polymerase sporulation-specific sigma factor